MLVNRPSLALHATTLLAMLCCSVSIWMALQLPQFEGRWLIENGTLMIEIPGPENAETQRLLPHTVSNSQYEIQAERNDFLEDPDFVDRYQDYNRIIERQDLWTQLGNHELTIHATTLTGEAVIVQTRLRPRQPGDLPVTFWVQQMVALLALVISGWVFWLRHHDTAARLFFASSASLMPAILAASVYSTRSWSLPSDWMLWLSRINHVGTEATVAFMLMMFMVYPQRLPVWRFRHGIALLLAGLAMAELSQWNDNLEMSLRFPVLLQILAIILLGIWQWRASARQPIQRAALRWLLSAILITVTLVSWNSMVANLLEVAPPFSQSDSIALFLILYLGIALGLRRYRLFDMDIWSYRTLLWTAGSGLILLLDYLLLAGIGLSQNLSMGLSLFLTGWIYLPLRQWLWNWMVGSPWQPDNNLMPQLSAIAWQADEQRQHSWQALLQTHFQPLHLSSASTDTGDTTRLEHDGQQLLIAAPAGMTAIRLEFAQHGARLFNREDVHFANTLSRLLEQLINDRRDYQQGIDQERRRIGRDLHDNIGARLLKLLHRLRNTPNEDLARDAILDLRSTINAIDSPLQPFADTLADLRIEISGRCEAAAVNLTWQVPFELPTNNLKPVVRSVLTSVLRELVSNALRHASPSEIVISMPVAPSMTMPLHMVISNDGLHANPDHWQEGYGLRNIRGRLQELGGNLSLQPSQSGQVSIHLTFPSDIWA